MHTYHRTHRIKAGVSHPTMSTASGAPEAPGPNQVLIRIGATSLNYRDLLTLADPGTLDSAGAGLVPLSDAAGTVVDVGQGVTRWKRGDRVSPNFFPGWTHGAFSTAYLQRALGGGGTDGVLRDYMVMEESALVSVPEHLSLAEAATLPCAGLTAWHALFEGGQLTAGETVLVQGTGGVAMFGLQLAVAHGAKVIVTSSSDDKLDRAREMGAWQTINYRSEPEWDRIALELTKGRGVDHILELGGPDTYQRSVNAVAAGGRIAQIGVLTGFAAQADIRPLQFKNASIHGICVGSVAQYTRLNQFLADKQLHPVIDKRFSFEQAADAYTHLRHAQHFGKLVIECE